MRRRETERNDSGTDCKSAPAGEATDFFEFTANNSNVEWSHQSVQSNFGGSQFEIVSTSGLKGQSFSPTLESQFIERNLKLIGTTHSHPNGRLSASDDDRKNVINSKFPSAGRSIYVPEQGYITYDQSGFLHNGRWDKKR